RLELGEVLDDAVVDDHDAPLAIGVGVRVHLGGPAVGGPPSVTDAEVPGGHPGTHLVGQQVHLGLGLGDAGELARVLQHRDHGRGAAQANSCCRLTVIVTVLKAEVTALLPVLTGRVKLLVALSPVMSIGVGTATPLIWLTAATGPRIDTISLGLTETLETW